MNTVIEANHLIKTYGSDREKTRVVNDVSLKIERGEFVSVMGPSGSGKSTLLYLLSGMEQTDNGKVQFCGEELQNKKEMELADIRRNRMGFVFQQPTFLKNLNILENITLPAFRENYKNKFEIIQRAKKLMEQMNISDLAKRNISQVSGGQLQRAGICRALINNPEMIFGDEPTGALNSKTTAEILKILTQINKEGKTVLLVTHDPKVASQTRHIMFMKDGRIEGELKFASLQENHQDLRISKIGEMMEKIGI